MTVMIPAWVDNQLVPVEKIAVHLRGLRHKAVSVFVMQGDKVLIQRRALGKYHTPGLWANTCCTHPNWEEAPLACAQRRLNEELGIIGLQLEHKDQVEYRADVGGGLVEHELVDIYLSRVKTSISVAANPDEVMDVEWVEMAELVERVDRNPDKFTPWLRIYLEQHAARIFA